MVGIRRTQGMPTSKRLRTPRAILESRLAHRSATAHNAPDRIVTEPNMNSAPSSSPDSSADSGVNLINVLAGELERPRPLPAQVVKHLSGTHGVERENIGEFLVRELPALEDYEIDLALAPVFTPTLAEQAVFAELLGEHSVPTSEWPELARTLTERPTIAHLVTDDGTAHAVPLRDVSIERFVHRLRLNGTIPPALFTLIAQRVPVANQPFIKAIARRATWELSSRAPILMSFLKQSEASAESWSDDASRLLRLVETYEPVDIPDLLGRIPHWEQVLRHEISAGGSPKPFFNERVQELHGGGRDQRGRADVSPQQQELNFLSRLRTWLSS